MQLRRRPTAPVTDSWDAVLALLFPNGLDGEQRARVDAAVAGRSPSAPAMRAALGALDQQDASSPVTIRWGADDIELVDVRGVRLATDRADASVSIQIAEATYEPHVVATLERLLKDGDVFVDVGANIGYHAVIGSTLVGPAGRVIAIEANAENARLLLHTIAVNSIENITVLPVALAGGWGHVAFGAHLGSNGGFLNDAVAAGGSGRGTVVPTVPLDDLGLERVSVVKIDVEGAEGLVIDGALATLTAHRPTLIMEFSVEMTTRVSRRDPAAHLGRFVELGYSIAIIDRVSQETVPVDSVDGLLAGWGSLARIEDLLLQPAHR